MFSLPGAGAYQHDRYLCVSNEIVADSPANFVQREIAVIYVSVFDRFIYNVSFHHFGKSLFVLLVIMMKTDKYFGSRGLGHRHSPACSKSVKSSTSAIFAGRRL